jgi:biopolymer transport protein ExbB
VSKKFVSPEETIRENNTMSRWMKVGLVTVIFGVIGAWTTSVFAQAAAPAAGGAPAVAAPAAAGTMAVDPNAAVAGEKSKSTGLGFWAVISSSGWLGILIWLALLGVSIAAVALAIDSFVTVKEEKIAPPELVKEVREAMEQGDVMKAIQQCQKKETPLSNVLIAGFQNVQEGFDVIQEMVGAAADSESEKLVQRVAYLIVCANIAPMVGLLGTVQGMIFAFGTLATQEAGAAQQAMLAMNIAQALWTTAAGLVVAIPALSFYTYFKNRATRIILSMEHLTMDLIKALRNVEVVQE